MLLAVLMPWIPIRTIRAEVPLWRASPPTDLALQHDIISRLNALRCTAAAQTKCTRVPRANMTCDTYPQRSVSKEVGMTINQQSKVPMHAVKVSSDPGASQGARRRLEVRRIGAAGDPARQRFRGCCACTAPYVLQRRQASHSAGRRPVHQAR